MRRRRALILLVAGVAVLAAFFVVTKVVMAPKNNPAAAVLAAPGKARAAAAAVNAAGKNLGAKLGSGIDSPSTTTASVAPAGKQPVAATSGPAPNSTRNPFLP